MNRRKAAWILGGLALFAAAALTFLATTTTGARWSLAVAGALAPGGLRIADVHGRLIGPLELEDVRYRSTTGDSIRIRALELDWRPRALFDNTVHITRLRLSGVSIHTLPASPAPTAPTRSRPRTLVPVRLIVDEARVRGLTLQRAGATPVHLDEIVLRARASKRRIELGELRVKAPQGELTLAGAASVQSPYRVDLKTRWSLQLEGHPPVAGRGRLHGTLARLRLEQRVSGALRMDIDARVDHPLGARRWHARIRLLELDPRHWDPSWPRAKVTAWVHAQGQGSDVRVAGTAGAAIPDAPKLLAQFYLAYRDGRWRLAPLVVTAPGGHRLFVSGEVRTRPAPAQGSLEARWTGLVWPLGGSPAWTSRNGDVRVEGTRNDYRFRLAAHLGGARLPRGDWRIEGDGDATGLRLQSLTADLLGGRLRGTGQVTWRPRRALELKLRAEHIDPAVRWKDWPGQLTADLSLTATGTAGDTQARLSLSSLSGTLRGRPVRGALLARRDGNDLTLSTLSLHIGDSELGASGSVGTRWDLRWRLRAPHLAALVPQGGGAVDAEGAVRGPRQAPVAAATLRARDLRVADAAVKTLDARFSIGTRADQPVDLALTAEGMHAGNFDATRAELNAAGTAARQEWHARLLTPAWGVRVAAAGGRAGGRWRGRLERADLTPVRGSTWRLAEPVPVTFGSGAVDVGRACWRDGAAHLCGTLQRQRTGAWNTALQAHAVPLAILDPLLAGGARASGTLEGEARFARSAAGIPRGTARIQAGPGSVSYPAAAGGEHIAYRKIDARLQLDPNVARGRLALDLGGIGTVNADIILGAANAAAPWPQRVLQGRVRADLLNLAWIGIAFPQIQRAHGALKADLRLAGTLRRPVITGRAAVTGAGAELPALGIQLNDLQLDARGTGANAVTLRGSARSGKGTLSVSGAARPGTAGRWIGQLHVTGSDFTAIDIPTARVTIAPDLDLRLAGRDLNLAGTVRVPRANLDWHTPQGATRASPDVVIVGTPQGTGKTPTWRVHARLRLVLGDKVRVRVHGFKGNITGQVLAIDEPGKPTLGQGELKINDGVYKAYGQELKISQGHLLFGGGPIADPGIAFTSNRKVGDVSAGIRVTGTVNDPKLTLFSTPAMAQSDILSYVLLGRPINQVSAAQGAALSSAAAGLGIGGANLLLGRLGSLLDLQEAQIESGGLTTPAAPPTAGLPPAVANAIAPSTSSATSASLVLGKYLSPRLYVQYTTSLFQPGNIFRVRYKLSRRWSVSTETGIESGIDFLYSVER